MRRVLEDLLLQPGVPGGALEEVAQEALQVLLREEGPGGHSGPQQGHLRPLRQTKGCWQKGL